VATALAPAFADPVLAAQSTFRCIMDAMARPGTIIGLSEPVEPPRPLSRGGAAVALTLFDQDSPVWLDGALAAEEDVAYWLRFHTGAPIVTDPKQAMFAVLSDPEQAPPFDAFAVGTPEYPDRSATLVLQVDSLEQGHTLILAGPGIRGTSILCARPLPADLPRRLAANRAHFPRGIDLLLVTEGAIAALPRSVVLKDEA
jgi:alpha-D-ribose 1-methylphosphonate 5-triphosphate synthase subunit PhnH